MEKDRVSRILLVTLMVSLVILAFLTPRVFGQSAAQITVQDRAVAPTVSTVIYISISGVPTPGLKEMEVGPKGAFTYDPQLLQVQAVTGLGPYQITSKTIDNSTGRMEFKVTAPKGETIIQGRIIKLEVRTLGNAGESTPLKITRIDTFKDAQGKDISYSIRNGVFSIQGKPTSPPRADFTSSPSSPSTADSVKFTDHSTDPDGSIQNWQWDFGDGATSTAQNPTHRFEDPGTYTITLTILDDKGAMDKDSQAINVSQAPPNQPPQAAFTFSPKKPSTQDPVQFTDQSSDPDGQISFRWWDFGDGSTSVKKNPTHTYSGPDKYTVLLKVVDNRGAISTFTQQVTVVKSSLVQPPEAAFTYSPSDPTTQDTVSFTDKSTDSDGRIVMRWWDFGEGTTTTLPNPSHQYSQPGTYSVTLKVVDNDGASDSTTRQIKVLAVKKDPQPDFTFSPQNPNPGQPVQFTDESSDPDGTIQSWEWDFGDGGTSSKQNPTHTYGEKGEYTIKLTVTDNDDLTGTITKKITVGKPKPGVVVHCYPNPASNGVTFEYKLPEGTTKATLYVYDLTGKLIFRQPFRVEETQHLWNLKSGSGQDLPNGIYFYQLVAKDDKGQLVGRSAIGKLIIQR